MWPIIYGVTNLNYFPSLLYTMLLFQYFEHIHRCATVQLWKKEFLVDLPNIVCGCIREYVVLARVSSETSVNITSYSKIFTLLGI